LLALMLIFLFIMSLYKHFLLYVRNLIFVNLVVGCIGWMLIELLSALYLYFVVTSDTVSVLIDNNCVIQQFHRIFLIWAAAALLTISRLLSCCRTHPLRHLLISQSHGVNQCDDLYLRSHVL